MEINKNSKGQIVKKGKGIIAKQTFILSASASSSEQSLTSHEKMNSILVRAKPLCLAKSVSIVTDFTHLTDLSSLYPILEYKKKLALGQVLTSLSSVSHFAS